MPITVLSDVIMSNMVLSSGVRGKNMRLNSRVAMNNGYESINVIWTKTLRQFELGTVPMLVEQWQAIEALHEITEGGAYGFLMEDPKDCEIDDGVLTLVSGTTYQLKKRYIDAGSSRFKDRTITRPKASTFRLFNLGAEVVTFTLDATTGIVTIPSAPTAADLSWSGRFYLPVHFLEDSIDWELLAPGPASQRLLSGPSIMIQEIRE